MAIVALTGAPQAGASTAALALLHAWPRPVLLVDADPEAGPVRAGLLQAAFGPERGLAALAAATRHADAAGEIARQWVQVGTDAHPRLILPGLTDPAQGAAVEYAWEPIARALANLPASGLDVLIDVGRSNISGHRGALARTADLVVFAVRAHLPGVAGAAPRLRPLAAALAAGAPPVPLAALVIEADAACGNRYPVNEVASTLEAARVGHLPHDARTAAYLTTGGPAPRGLEQSALLRGARSLAGDIARMCADRAHAIAAPGRDVGHG